MSNSVWLTRKFAYLMPCCCRCFFVGMQCVDFTRAFSFSQFQGCMGYAALTWHATDKEPRELLFPGQPLLGFLHQTESPEQSSLSSRPGLGFQSSGIPHLWSSYPVHLLFILLRLVSNKPLDHHKNNDPRIMISSPWLLVLIHRNQANYCDYCPRMIWY